MLGMLRKGAISTLATREPIGIEPTFLQVIMAVLGSQACIGRPCPAPVIELLTVST